MFSFTIIFAIDLLLKVVHCVDAKAQDFNVMNCQSTICIYDFVYSS